MSACYVETFREDAAGSWGWQCFTCSVESRGFSTCFDADEAGDEHAAQAEDERRVNYTQRTQR